MENALFSKEMSTANSTLSTARFHFQSSQRREQARVAISVNKDQEYGHLNFKEESISEKKNYIWNPKVLRKARVKKKCSPFITTV